MLQSELPVGEEKLQKALQQGEVTCAVAEPEDKEVIEEEVAILQEEFDNYTESLQRTKSLLEVGIVKVDLNFCQPNTSLIGRNLWFAITIMATVTLY